MPSVALKLERWRESVCGREVKRSTRGKEHLCECTEQGESVAIGVGDSAEDAAKDAADKLWALALASAGDPTNPRPRWSK